LRRVGREENETGRPGAAMNRDKLDPRRVAGGFAAGFAAGILMCGFFGLPAMSRTVDGRAGDAERGKALFEKRCTGCHSLDQDKEGPRLHDVYGRKAGTVAGFQYSDALKRAQITWDDVLLDKWLTDTESVIPNNDMAFHVPKADERADIIAFLRATTQLAQ
jgi:cytochrome c